MQVAAALGLAVLCLTGCSGGDDEPGAAPSSAATTARSTASPAPAPTGSRVCDPVTGAQTLARGVITATRKGPVLGPAVSLVLLDLRGQASMGASEPAPFGPAFGELVAAADDLNTRAEAALPAGAMPLDTPVRVDPGRLEAALDAVVRLCGPGPSTSPSSIGLPTPRTGQPA